MSFIIARYESSHLCKEMSYEIKSKKIYRHYVARIKILEGISSEMIPCNSVSWIVIENYYSRGRMRQ